MPAVVARRAQVRGDREVPSHQHRRCEIAASRCQETSARPIGRRQRAPGGRTMITKSEWQMVHHSMMAEERGHGGEPPASEEVFAYMRGELSPEDEARLRERLVNYPDLVRTL